MRETRTVAERQRQKWRSGRKSKVREVRTMIVNVETKRDGREEELLSFSCSES